MQKYLTMNSLIICLICMIGIVWTLAVMIDIFSDHKVSQYSLELYENKCKKVSEELHSSYIYYQGECYIKLLR